MKLSRKDKAKLKYLNSPEGKFLKRVVATHGLTLSEVDDCVLPDDFIFDGWKVVEGVFCKTVGEYKAALEKNDNDMGGWSG